LAWTESPAQYLQPVWPPREFFCRILASLVKDPNAAGYAVIAPLAEKAIQAVLPAKAGTN
jgi:hypothetical protein